MRAEQPSGSQERLSELDAMRGCAALLVVGYHVHTQYGGYEIFARAYLAVDFFFMLSGYVMAKTYEGKIREGSLKPFPWLISRYRRLWGPLFVGTCIGTLNFLAQGADLNTCATVAGLALVPVFGFERPFPLNRPTWSIFFELIANAVHARVLSRLPIVGVAALAALSAIGLMFSGLALGNISVGHVSDTFWAGVPRVLLAYCIGIVVFRSGFRLPGVAGLGTLLLTVLLLVIPYGLIWDLAFVAAVCPLLIALSLRPFGGRIASAVGAISFPLYAVHYPILELSRHVQFSPWEAALTSILAAIVVALAVDRRLLRIFANSSSQPVSA